MIHEQQEFFILLHFTSKFNLMFSFVFHACLLQLAQHSKMSLTISQDSLCRLNAETSLEVTLVILIRLTSALGNVLIAFVINK